MRLPRFRPKLGMLAVLVALVANGFGAERTIRRVQAPGMAKIGMLDGVR